MEDYTIYSYSPGTKKYTKLGFITSDDTKSAKANWAIENEWKPTEKGEVLFAKGPLCR